MFAILIWIIQTFIAVGHIDDHNIILKDDKILTMQLQKYPLFRNFIDIFHHRLVQIQYISFCVWHVYTVWYPVVEQTRTRPVIMNENKKNITLKKWLQKNTNTAIQYEPDFVLYCFASYYVYSIVRI